MANTPHNDKEQEIETSQPTTKQGTGYKILDAVVSVFDMLVHNTRKDVSATFIAILILFAVSGWGVVVWMVSKNDKGSIQSFDKFREDVQKEKEYCDREMQILRGENQDLKKELLDLEKIYKQDQKTCNESITKLYERLVKK